VEERLDYLFRLDALLLAPLLAAFLAAFFVRPLTVFLRFDGPFMSFWECLVQLINSRLVYHRRCEC